MPAQAEPDDEALREVVEVPFSGEEAGGRYLDLHEPFHRWVNAKFGSQIDYVEYLTGFAALDAVPRAQRLTKPYRCAPACRKLLVDMGRPGSYLFWADHC